MQGHGGQGCWLLLSESQVDQGDVFGSSMGMRTRTDGAVMTKLVPEVNNKVMKQTTLAQTFYQPTVGCRNEDEWKEGIRK